MESALISEASFLATRLAPQRFWDLTEPPDFRLMNRVDCVLVLEEFPFILYLILFLRSYRSFLSSPFLLVGKLLSDTPTCGNCGYRWRATDARSSRFIFVAHYFAKARYSTTITGLESGVFALNHLHDNWKCVQRRTLAGAYLMTGNLFGAIKIVQCWN